MQIILVENDGVDVLMMRSLFDPNVAAITLISEDASIEPPIAFIPKEALIQLLEQLNAKS